MFLRRLYLLCCSGDDVEIPWKKCSYLHGISTASYAERPWQDAEWEAEEPLQNMIISGSKEMGEGHLCKIIWNIFLDLVCVQVFRFGAWEKGRAQ